jgi:hypothetical protein
MRRIASLIELPTPLPATVAWSETNVLALVKGTERYVFLYLDSERTEALRVFGRYASNPELSFTWYDAAVLSGKLREMRQLKATCQPSGQ